MRTAYRISILAGLLFLVGGTALAQTSADKDFLKNCAECHGADGKGAQPEKRALRGYISTDLTQISKRNGGTFPSQKVYDAIDGRTRIGAHFQGDMPRWGQRYRVDENDHSKTEQEVRERISGLVGFIESMQEK